MSKRIADLAATLIHMVDSGKYVNVRWTYDYIGYILGVNRPTAERVMHYLRNTDDMHIWTVGTYKSEWTITATDDTREALDGLVNQMRHNLTRSLTFLHQARTLARIDPEPRHQRIWIGLEIRAERVVTEQKAMMQELVVF